MLDHKWQSLWVTSGVSRVGVHKRNPQRQHMTRQDNMLHVSRHFGHFETSRLVRGRIVKVIPSCHHCRLALLECDGYHIHDLTFLCPSLSHILDFTTFGGLTIPHTNTSYKPNSNSEMDMCGKFLVTVVLTRDDDDTNSHVSDIPLSLPAIAHVASDNSALVTFSHADSNLMRHVPSLHPISRQTWVNLWQLRYPSTYPQTCNGSSEQRKSKGERQRTCQNNSRRGDCIGGDHRNSKSKKAHQNLGIQVSQESEQTTLYKLQEKKLVVRLEIQIIIGNFPMCKTQMSSRMQVRRQQLLQFTLRRMMNARCTCRKYSWMIRPNSM